MNPLVLQCLNLKAHRTSKEEDKKKHEDFLNRMVAKGYSARQVRLLCEWYLRVRKSS